MSWAFRRWHLTAWFSHVQNLRLPPLFTKITPGRGWKGSRPGLALIWLVIKLRIYKEVWTNRIKGKIERSNILMGYAKSIGYRRSWLAKSHFPPAFTYRKTPTLSMNLQELDFPHDPPSYYHYVGPMVLEEAHKTEVPAVRIAQKARAAGQKVIYCTFGSILKGDPRLLQATIDAVANRKDWTLIISSRVSSSQLNLDSSNVHLFEYVPQKAVLMHSDCCIHHAGINTVNECLHFGVPTLIYNAEAVDENGVTARLDLHGLAKIGNRQLDGPVEIEQHLNEVLSSPTWAERTAHFRAIYLSKDQEGQLLRLIDQMAIK